MKENFLSCHGAVFQVIGYFLVSQIVLHVEDVLHVLCFSLLFFPLSGYVNCLPCVWKVFAV